MDDAVRVLVCGSRTFTDAGAVFTVLDGLDLFHAGELAVIHGCAAGADHAASTWAQDTGRTAYGFEADWRTHGKRAGYLRNVQMLEEGKPDVVWAFVDKPLAESKGTAMMLDLARKAGVVAYVVQTSPAPPSGDERPTDGLG